MADGNTISVPQFILSMVIVGVMLGVFIGAVIGTAFASGSLCYRIVLSMSHGSVVLVGSLAILLGAMTMVALMSRGSSRSSRSVYDRPHDAQQGTESPTDPLGPSARD